jgi:uncharacterized iron-regulated membrane protein
MGNALGPQAATARGAARKLDWRRKMSDHVAYALLVYTGLQIFLTMGQLKTSSGSILPYFALIVLIAAIIPGCRMFEKRWEGIGDAAATNPELRDRFRRDVVILWLLAILLPVALTLLFLAIAKVL